MIDICAIPVDITEHIIKFRNFLTHSWKDLDDIMEFHDWDDDGNFIDDWIQNCWEFLIERELLGKNNLILTPFSMTHVAQSKKRPTHIVIAIPKNEKK